MGKGSVSRKMRRSKSHRKHHERERRRAQHKLGPDGSANIKTHRPVDEHPYRGYGW